jgi:Ca2+-binding RTX toxin-like protein
VDDRITENASQGTDTVFSPVTYILQNNLENLTLQGTLTINGTGNALNNDITGNNADNLLTGEDGNDTLNGQGGADTMIGGTGNDSYYVDNVNDSITENASQGTDTIFSTLEYTLGDNLENLTLYGSLSINGTGNALNNNITGNSSANTLTGLDGNDILDGGTGADILVGGAGNDSYYVDNVGDSITENDSQGTDTVFSTIEYTLGDNLENLTLYGSLSINGTGNALNNNITGNGGANTLTGLDGNDTLNGGTGADILIGGAGNDSYYVDNVGDSITENDSQGTDTVFSTISYTLQDNLENLTLQGSLSINGTGNSLNNNIIGNGVANTLTGGDGNDTLNGGIGVDALSGGTGNDNYYVDNLGDSITENTDEGTDTVFSTVSYNLQDNLENLTLQGGINGIGNALNNNIIGNSSANILNGGAGADTLAGGGGNDSYYLDDGLDSITENSSQGTDAVFSTVSYILQNNLENLTLQGSLSINGAGNALNNNITGNSADNILNGDAGADTLNGGSGADTFVFQFGQSSVMGSDLLNDLTIDTDKIDLLTQGGLATGSPVNFTRAADNSTATSLRALSTQVFIDANGAIPGNQGLGVNSAVLVRVTTGAIAGTYLIINDNTTGLQLNNDLAINLTAYSGTLPSLGNINVSSFFVV